MAYNQDFCIPHANFVRGFDLPSDLNPGTYKFYAKVTYADGSFSIGEHSFRVIKNDVLFYYTIGISIVVLVIIILLFIKSKSLIEKLKIKREVAKIVKERMKE